MVEIYYLNYLDIENKELRTGRFVSLNDYETLLNSKFELEHWKGKDNILISKPTSEAWLLITHSMIKETGEVKNREITVLHYDVVKLKDILKRLCKNNNLVYAKDIWKEIITDRGLDIDVNSFNGGNNRALFYFPLYYYPMKILDYYNLVEYTSRGVVSLNKTLVA
jgi:hypothetical protein